MSRQSKYIQELLNFQAERHDIMRQIAEATAQEQEILLNKLLEEESSDEYSFAEKLADKVASFGGSWSFIIYFFVALVAWMSYNVASFTKTHFDPYPFILLNLVLSCVAAMQAPIILMSQKRQEFRDRKRAQDDYIINLKSELKSRGVDKKMDLLINELFTELLKVQATQIKKLDRLETMVSKLHPMVKGILYQQQPDGGSDVDNGSRLS